jgi:CBS domain containing-hemolysin-like protein
VTAVLLIVAALLLTAVCAVFVAAEFSLTTVERSQVRQAAEAGERGAARVLKAVRRLSFQLSGAQLGITVTSLVIGMLAEPSVSALLRGPLEAAGLPAGAAESAALVAGVALSAGVLMVAGELVPKNWAISRPLAAARAVAGPLGVFAAMFAPLIGHLNRSANRVVRGLSLEPAEELAAARTPGELIALARHSAREGVLGAETARQFTGALRLRELTAQNVMTPRVDVEALDIGARAADVAGLTRATGLSRFPVYRDTLDDVAGVVHIKDALAVPAGQRGACPVTALMSAPLLVPESLAADVLLDRLRGEQALAVVLDEYGGTAGVVTLEDIVEEVLGEVRDEHDPGQHESLAVLAPAADGRRRWSADGITRTGQLRELGMPVPDGPYQTLAGLLAARLGRIPRAGDTVLLEGWLLEVAQVAHHAADRVRVTALAAGPGSAGGKRDREGAGR